MKRVIYSLYVDVPAEEHYGQSKQRNDTVAKAKITVNAFKKHYKKFRERTCQFEILASVDMNLENQFMLIMLVLEFRKPNYFWNVGIGI